MNTLKRDQFVLKVLATKGVTLEAVVEMSATELEELKLSRVIVEAIEDFKVKGLVTIDAVNEAIEIERATGTKTEVVREELVDEYKGEEDAKDASETETVPMVEEAKKHTIPEELVRIIEPVEMPEEVKELVQEIVESNSVSEEELQEIVAKFSDKGVPSLTKKVKEEIGDKDVDQEILRELIKAQVKVNKGK